MKREMKVFVFMSLDYDLTKPDPYRHPKVWAPDPWGRKVDDTAERVFISEQTFMVDIPDDFNPVPRQIVELKKEKYAAMVRHQRALAQIEDKMSKMLALANEMPAPTTTEGAAK